MPCTALDRAAGMRDTRIGWVCAIAGLLGAALALAFQEWTSVVDWAVDVGGKPYDSLPAFVPVLFEVGVLCGGLASVLALFIVTRIYPGKRAQLAHPRSTDDRFVVQLDASGPAFDAERASELLAQHGALESGERLSEAAA